MLEGILGPDHPEFANVLSEVGECHRQIGQYDEADVCFDHCATILKKSFGCIHPSYARCLGLKA